MFDEKPWFARAFPFLSATDAVTLCDRSLFPLISTLPALRHLLTKQGIALYMLLIGCLLLGPWQADFVQGYGFSASAARNGEFWRFLTSHLVHASWAHLLLNAIALFVLQQMFGRELNTIVFIWGYVVVAFGIGLCILAFGGRGIYIGLSGMLHGLFALGACLALRRDVLTSAGVLIIVSAKVFWEQIDGASSLIERIVGTPVAIDAHLYGLAAGVLLGAALSATVLRKSGE